MRTLLLLSIMLLAAPAWAQEAVVPVGRLMQALNLHFESGESTLHPSSLPALDAVADVLRRSSDLRIQISGHTDNVGSEATNQALSLERARSVRAYLVARHGLAPDRLETAGYGESLPIALNDTPTGRALNRRVEFRALEDPPQPSASPETDTIAADVQPVEDVRVQIEEAVQDALREVVPEPEIEDETEELLLDRIAAFEARLREDGASSPGSTLQLLPFTGFYLRSDLPVVMGIRLDLPTSLLGSARLQPEAAVAFRADDNAYVLGANLVLPVQIGPDFVANAGAGIGFHNLDRVESVLTLLIGAEYRFEFGRVFGEVATQDFFDFTRVIIGYRQPF